MQSSSNQITADLIYALAIRGEAATNGEAL